MSNIAVSVHAFSKGPFIHIGPLTLSPWLLLDKKNDPVLSNAHEYTVPVQNVQDGLAKYKTGFPEHLENIENLKKVMTSFSSHENMMEFYNFHEKNENFSCC